MVKQILIKWPLAALKKYIKDHNKVVRENISKEIKEARVQYNQQLKVRRREMKAAKEIQTKGKEKNDIVDSIMEEPLIVKAIKADMDAKRAPKGFRFRADKVLVTKKPFDRLEEKREGVKKIKLEKAQKLIDELKDIDKKYSPSNLKKLFGGMKGAEERRKATKALGDWTTKWNKLKMGSDPRLNTIFNRIKKNMLEASSKHPSETIEDEPKKVKEEKKKTDAKIKVPKIIITEAEEPTGGAPAEPKSQLGPIPKSKVKIRVAPKKKPKPPADERERIADMKRAIEDARKKGKKLSGLEFQLKELERQFDISGIKATPKPKKQIKQKKEEIGEAIMPIDRVIGGVIKDLVNQRNISNNLEIIKSIKSGYYQSEDKGVLSPNMTLEKFRGGSFRIVAQSNNLINEYLFDEKGNLIDRKQTFKEKPKKEEKKKPKPPTPPPPEPETTDEETEEEEVYDRSKVKVIKGIGRNLKEIWLDYMEYRNGGDPYTEADQKFELEQFEEIEKQFFEAKETRTDPSNSAAVQAKAGATQSRIRNDIKQEIKDVGEGMKKLYQKLTPQLFRAYEDKKPSSQAAIDKILNK